MKNKFIIVLTFWDTIQHYIFDSPNSLEENKRKLFDVLNLKQKDRPSSIDFGLSENHNPQILELDSWFVVNGVVMMKLSDWIQFNHNGKF